MGPRKVLLQSDSQAMVMVITEDQEEYSRHSYTLQHIR
ncbi:hypothetical protein LINPERHAP1_LOCUS3979 [Linum perenne]